MPFVLDASVAAAWLLNETDHRGPLIGIDHLAIDRATAPAIWWFEIRNILVMAERRQRLAQAAVRQLWRNLGDIPVEMHGRPEGEQVRRLAVGHGLTFYDASYLELAIRLGFPLASLDRALVRAARAEHVPVLGDE